MAIPRSPYFEHHTSLEDLKFYLSSFEQEKFPDEIHQKIVQFQQDLNTIELKNNYPKKELKGTLPTKEKILELIVKVSGYNKWQIKNTSKKELQDEIEIIKENYDVSFDEYCSYSLSFKTDSYHLVNMLTITCIPGYVSIMAGDGKVTLGTDELLTLKEAKKWLKCCWP